MSGYLARLAARAGGAPAAAGPRLPSRFEPSASSAPTDAAALVPPPGTLAHDDLRSPERPAATRADEHAPAEARTPEVARTPEDDVAAVTVPADHRRAAHNAEAEVAAQAPPAEVAAPANAAFEARAAPEHAGPPLPRPSATAVAAAAPRVEAAPPRRAAAVPTARTSRDEASAAAPEPDVVHVTIGRIEVRATVAAPAVTSRSAPARRDAERSLHDYLARRSR